MTIRLLRVRRRIHFTPTNRRGAIAAFAAAGVGLVAATGGFAIAAVHNDRPTAIGAIGATTPTSPESISVPPTMVLLPTTTGVLALPQVDVDRDLGAVLRGLHAAARLAGAAPIDPNHPGLDVYGTGEVLEGIRSRLRNLKAEGVARRCSPGGQPSTNKVLDDDVFARLLTFPNVLITGHQAFFAVDALERIASTTIANLSAAERGQPIVANAVR